MALASNMQESTAKINWLDSKKYKGHADYVSMVLKKGTTFKQFKAQVRSPATREYLPIFVYDLHKIPVTIEGKRYNWAMTVVGYHYMDNQIDMAKSVLRAAKAVEMKLQESNPTIGKGVVLLATNLKIQPNMGIAPALNKAGFGACTVEELLKKTNGSQEKVLNAGIAVGRIKYIEKGMEAKAKVSFGDIALYDELPERVPIAAAIITFAPQTPLSHVNLLAKNRKTVNIYTQKNVFLKKYAFKNGDLVRLSAFIGNNTNYFTIKAATIEEQTVWQAEHKQLVIDIPSPQYDLAFISYFDTGKAAVQKVEYIGAKAANYALLQRNLQNTPWAETIRPGFGIPFFFYKETLELSNTTTLIDSFLIQKDKLSASEKKAFLASIRKRIKKGKVSGNLLKQVRAVCSKYFVNTKIRLRSSTNCEDLAQFNGAGLYDSKGFMTTENSNDSLQKVLLKVYASLWNEAAFEEREFYGINHRKVAMAILINEAYDNEWANGVVISQPNTDKKTISIYINAQQGEHLVTNPKQGELAEAIIFARADSDWYNIEQQSTIGSVFEGRQELRKLLFNLRNLTAKIHTLLIEDKEGYGIDVEFKILKTTNAANEAVYKLYVKQARLLGSVLPE